MNEFVATSIVAFLALGQSKIDSPNISVEVDGKVLIFADNAPMVYRGRVLVPMRGIFEAIGVLEMAKQELLMAALDDSDDEEEGE
jgi:hypothetical protein